ncbi:hypothetical protein A3L04_06395 [Thermococcus chitonophagus]|uniref:CpXC domain-containing protein n=1 Tax=Thermococcus chitonophagus TaxID=54262 RepID=A0A2Z2N6P6_9EURY|nr:hypothetical protein [Thermococcus chitonophagus]ASJ16727.1 hypothetical protein A3L04_06395 [Thermococcus chitonophagus]
MNNVPRKCLYCGNQNITVMKASKIIFSLQTLAQIVSSGQITEYEIVTSPFKIVCEYCGKRYIIIADHDNNPEFLNFVLDKLQFENEEAIAQEIISWGIDPRDIFYNAYAIVIPEGIANNTRRWLSSKTKKVAYELHILFKSNGQNFYLSAYRNNKTGEIIGKHIEIIR